MPGTEAIGLAGKVGGKSVWERARAIVATGSELAARFRLSQLGFVRPALMFDGGRVVVTVNYRKVRIPVSQPENQRGCVWMISAGESPSGEFVT